MCHANETRILRSAASVTHQSPVESCLSLRLRGFFALPHHHTGAFVVQNITVLKRN